MPPSIMQCSLVLSHPLLNVLLQLRKRTLAVANTLQTLHRIVQREHCFIQANAKLLDITVESAKKSDELVRMSRGGDMLASPVCIYCVLSVFADCACRKELCCILVR